MEKIENSNAKERSTISFLDILLVIAKRWKMIFFITFFSAIFIAGLMLASKLGSPNFILPDVYSPDVKVMFRENSGAGGLSSLAGENAALLSLAGLGEGSTSKKSDKAEVILYTRECLDIIIEKHNLIEYFELQESPAPKSAARALLKENINVDTDVKSSVMTIKYSDTNREFATMILQSLLNELERRYKMFEDEVITETIADLVQNLENAERDFKEAQDQIIVFSQRHGIIDLEMQAEYQVREMAALKNQILSLEIEIDKILEYKSSSDPEVLQKRKELKQTKDLLSQRKTGFKEYSIDDIPMQKLPEVAAEFKNLKAEVEAKSLVYYTLKSQLATSRIKLYSGSSSFQIIDNAEIPEIKSGPSRAKICILFVFAMIFLSIFLAFFLEYYENLKKDPEEADKLNEIFSYFKFLRFFKRSGRRKKIE
ncbi:MAG: hypothetical protein JXR63_13965 [Spirochaetales bacterium]|nr:hypothetical protein [Spirochaetales bacterium]